MQLVLWTLIIHGSQREHIEATAAPKTKTGPENQISNNVHKSGFSSWPRIARPLPLKKADATSLNRRVLVFVYPQIRRTNAVFLSMEIGVNVWVRDTVSTEAWISGTIVDKAIDGSETVISVNCDSGASIVNFRLKSEHDDLSDLKLRNAADDEHADNLIKLPFLNEPAILHCLQERYKSGLIYTYTGPILIAVNPFK
eukprot:gene25028-27030_t